MAAKDPIASGSATKLTPATGAQITKNIFGLDVLPRPYTCPIADVQKLMPKVGSPDIRWKNLKATGQYNILETEGLQCKLTMEYKGLVSGTLPDPLISSDMSTGSVSATSGADGPADDQRTWEIVFYSPVRIYRYILDRNPSGPIYGTYEGGPVGGPSIMNQWIRDGNGRPQSSVTGISLTPRAELSGFTANPVPGTIYYECQESWRGVFIMTATA